VKTHTKSKCAHLKVAATNSTAAAGRGAWEDGDPSSRHWRLSLREGAQGRQDELSFGQFRTWRRNEDSPSNRHCRFSLREGTQGRQGELSFGQFRMGRMETTLRAATGGSQDELSFGQFTDWVSAVEGA
jgi:hypothetical protein